MTIDNGATLATPAPTSPLITGSAGTNHATKVDVQSQYQAVVAGLLAYYQPGDLFQLKAGTFTRDELIGEIQQFVAACEKTKGLYQAWRASVQDERGAEMKIRPMRSGVRNVTRARFGNDGAQLLQFGFAPVKVAVRSVESKAAAAKGAGDEGGEGDQGEEAEDGDQGGGGASDLAEGHRRRTPRL